MKTYALHFMAPFRVSVNEEERVAPGARQVLVKTLVSAISPGTELLIYRGEWPENLPVDENIPALAGAFRFPLKYGYASVGRVIELGAEVSDQWLHQRVFAFQPHQSHFLASPDQLILLPDVLSQEVAALLPNMETAVSFLMDGKPMIGERVMVFGQGVVGLLTTRLLSEIPLAMLITMDRHAIRRQKSELWGATRSLDPAAPFITEQVAELMSMQEAEGGADLVYELSGNPAALDLAIEATGFGGRIIVGSWYGAKRSNLGLGGRFHRGHMKILSSQVSRIAPDLSGRWTKARRLQWAIKMLSEHPPVDVITHRFHLSQAEHAYAILHEHPDQALQVILTYEDLS